MTFQCRPPCQRVSASERAARTACAAGAVMTSIRLTGLVKRYGPTVALGGLDLVAHSGEILGVAGPNGSGKSTMVGVLAGETPLDDGVVEVDGVPWTRPRHQGRCRASGTAAVSEPLGGGEPGRPVESASSSDGPRSTRRNAARPGLRPDRRRRPAARVAPFVSPTHVEIIARAPAGRRGGAFDEPNSALSFTESAELFEYMHALAQPARS